MVIGSPRQRDVQPGVDYGVAWQRFVDMIVACLDLAAGRGVTLWLGVGKNGVVVYKIPEMANLSSVSVRLAALALSDVAILSRECLHEHSRVLSERALPGLWRADGRGLSGILGRRSGAGGGQAAGTGMGDEVADPLDVLGPVRVPRDDGRANPEPDVGF